MRAIDLEFTRDSAVPEAEAPRAPAAPLPVSPSAPETPPNDPLRIAKYVQRIPTELLSAWSAHLCSRITDEFYESFKDRTK